MLEPIVAKSISMREVLKRLGIKHSGGMHSHIKKVIDNHEIDISHFKGQGWNKNNVGSTHCHTPENFIKEVLCIDGKGWKSYGIKKKLIKFQLKDNRCEICNLGPCWNNNELSLQLDHINGNSLDNRLENLRILCPNCHSQTSTFSGKKNRKRNNKKGYAAPRYSMSRPTKIDWPDVDILVKMVEETSYLAVGRQLGVSDNAIRKRIKTRST